MFKKKSKEVVFWNWFSKNSDNYYNFQNNQSELFTELKARLNLINSDLVFEFSGILEDGTREFVISADGIKSSFPAVLDLVDNAPNLKNWKIIAFRQPQKRLSKIQYKDIVLDPEDIFFKFGKDGSKIALELHLKDYKETIDWRNAVFLLLDKVIGEYNTEMCLSRIEKKSLNEIEKSDLFPISSLPKIIHEYRLEYNN